MKKDLRYATASCNWYLQQGQVGILVALEIIVKLSSKSEKEEDLKNWRIIYENSEDFDIQYINNDGLGCL